MHRITRHVYNSTKLAGIPRRLRVICLGLMMCVFNLPANAQFGELVAFESPGNTTYYLDAEIGDDENPGTRPESPWRTLSRVNTSRFAPGDSILIKSGTTYEGKLWPKGSGIPGRPVTIDAYGEGPRPVINTNGEASATILLENTSAWHVKNLELTNTGEKPEAFRYGLSILVEDRGEVGDFELVNLYVHDVNGAEDPGLGAGAGIIWRNRGATVSTRFNGLLVEGCVVKDCGRNGIAGESGYTQRDRWQPNVNVILRENEIDGVGGSGILLTGCDNAIVEYNRVKHAGKANKGQAGGIDLSGCDNAVVQYNQIAETVGRDSAALRCGSNSLENTFQFNFTLDNAGAMVAIVSETPGRGPDAGNHRTAVCYNISQNDNAGLGLIGPIRETRVYNNTLYNGPDTRNIAIRVDPRQGAPADVTIANNLFYTQGSATLDLGPPPPPDATPDATEADTPALTFTHNAYFGEHQQPETDTDCVTDHPKLVEPGIGISIEEGLDCYQTLPGSPLRGKGTRLVGHGRYDFASNPIPAGAPIDIGAFQAPSDNP